MTSAHFDLSDDDGRARGIAAAIAAMRTGRAALVPLDNQYGLAVDAFHPESIDVLRQARGRSAQWAPPLVVPSVAALQGVALVSQSGQALADAFWPGQVTLICLAQPSLRWQLGDVSGGVAIRMPRDPATLEVLNAIGPTAVVSAGPQQGRTASGCSAALGDHASVVLDAGTLNGPASTVVDLRQDPPTVLRVGPVGLSRLRAVATSTVSAVE